MVNSNVNNRFLYRKTLLYTVSFYSLIYMARKKSKKKKFDPMKAIRKQYKSEKAANAAWKKIFNE